MNQDEMIKLINEAEKEMDATLTHLATELKQIRTGKASPSMVESVKVSYYGSPTPLNQVANVATSDSKTLVIQPWDKSIIDDIEKAIFEANLGLTPQNDGETIHINIPPLTEDRRKELVKYMKTLGEDAKISLRNARHKAMEAIKKAKTDGLPEDSAKLQAEDIDSTTKKYAEKVESIVSTKETQLMNI